MDMGQMMTSLQYAGQVAQLTISFRDALVRARETHKGDPLTVPYLAQLVADDPDVIACWSESSDFPRRDYMTFAAEQAARAGVTAESFRTKAFSDSPAALHADALVELAIEQIRDAADPAASLLPNNPTDIARGQVGCYAVSTVCDSTEPEADKILACALLNAAAAAIEPART